MTLTWECHKCRGSGEWKGGTCWRCGGTGYEPGDRDKQDDSAGMQEPNVNPNDLDKIVENEKHEEVRDLLQGIVDAAKRGEGDAIKWLRERGLL